MIGLLLTMLLATQGTPVSLPAGTVSGKLLRADGSPARGIRVTALDVSDARGVAAPPLVVAVTETDAAGSYSFKDLPPDRYHVVAGPLLFPTYFPGVMERKDASVVVLSGEMGVAGIDFRLVPDDVRVRALLSSTKTLEIAWGAWLAGESGKPDWTQTLEEKLAAQLTQDRFVEDGEVAIDTLSDALIRLKAKPSPALLRSLFYHRTPEALILLSHLGPAANDVLLEALGGSKEYEWVGAANLLLANHAPGFVVLLLRDLQLRAELVVCAKEPSCIAGPPGTLGPGFLDGIRGRIQPERPPWPAYTLSNNGSSLLADGPIKIFYNRMVNMEGLDPRPVSRRTIPTPTATDRLNYIAAAAPGVTLGIQAFEQRRIVWKDDDTVKAEEKSFYEDILARYAALLRKLVAAGVLTDEEAARVATPQLYFTVSNSP